MHIPTALSFRMWEHPQQHETSVRVLICIELLFYIKNISSPNKGEKMQNEEKNVSKYTVTQQKFACCMTAAFMALKITKPDKNVLVDSFLVSTALGVGVQVGFQKT